MYNLPVAPSNVEVPTWVSYLVIASLEVLILSLIPPTQLKLPALKLDGATLPLEPAAIEEP